MSKLHSLLDFISNHKKALVIIFTILSVGVLDSNSLWNRHFRWENIKRLRAEIQRQQAEYDMHTQQLEELRTDIKAVEKVARENYYMTKPGEDLFIIQRSNEELISLPSDSTDTEDPLV